MTYAVRLFALVMPLLLLSSCKITKSSEEAASPNQIKEVANVGNANMADPVVDRDEVVPASPPASPVVDTQVSSETFQSKGAAQTVPVHPPPVSNNVIGCPIRNLSIQDFLLGNGTAIQNGRTVLENGQRINIWFQTDCGTSYPLNLKLCGGSGCVTQQVPPPVLSAGWWVTQVDLPFIPYLPETAAFSAEVSNAISATLGSASVPVTLLSPPPEEPTCVLSVTNQRPPVLAESQVEVSLETNVNLQVPGNALAFHVTGEADYSASATKTRTFTAPPSGSTVVTARIKYGSSFKFCNLAVGVMPITNTPFACKYKLPTYPVSYQDTIRIKVFSSGALGKLSLFEQRSQTWLSFTSSVARVIPAEDGAAFGYEISLPIRNEEATIAYEYGAVYLESTSGPGYCENAIGDPVAPQTYGLDGTSCGLGTGLSRPPLVGYGYFLLPVVGSPFSNTVSVELYTADSRFAYNVVQEGQPVYLPLITDGAVRSVSVRGQEATYLPRLLLTYPLSGGGLGSLPFLDATTLFPRTSGVYDINSFVTLPAGTVIPCTTQTPQLIIRNTHGAPMATINAIQNGGDVAIGLVYNFSKVPIRACLWNMRMKANLGCQEDNERSRREFVYNVYDQVPLAERPYLRMLPVGAQVD